MKAKVMKVLNILFWVLYGAGLSTLVYDVFKGPTFFEKVVIAINLICLFFMTKNVTGIAGQNVKLMEVVVQKQIRENKLLKISEINNDLHEDNLLTLNKAINLKNRAIEAKDKQIDDMKKYIYDNSI